MPTLWNKTLPIFVGAELKRGILSLLFFLHCKNIKLNSLELLLSNASTIWSDVYKVVKIQYWSMEGNPALENFGTVHLSVKSTFTTHSGDTSGR